MKRVLAYMAVGVVAALSTTPVMADLLIYEPFDYTSGSPLVGQQDVYSPGSPTWAGAGTANSSTVHQVGSASLTGPSGFPTSVGNDADLKGVDFKEYGRLALGSSYAANSTLYYSLLLNVPATQGLTVAHSNANANNDGVVAFNNSSGTGTEPNSWGGELAMRLGSASGTFNLGVRASTTAAGTTYWTSDLTPGQTYLVVVSYAIGATPGTGGLSSLWLNPSSATFGAATAPTASGSTVGDIGTAANDHMDSVILGAGIASGADPADTYVDELRIGTTWADVTAVPEPSTVALAGFSLVALMTWYRARRQ